MFGIFKSTTSASTQQQTASTAMAAQNPKGLFASANNSNVSIEQLQDILKIRYLLTFYSSVLYDGSSDAQNLFLYTYRKPENGYSKFQWGYKDNSMFTRSLTACKQVGANAVSEAFQLLKKFGVNFVSNQNQTDEEKLQELKLLYQAIDSLGQNLINNCNDITMASRLIELINYKESRLIFELNINQVAKIFITKFQNQDFNRDDYKELMVNLYLNYYCRSNQQINRKIDFYNAREIPELLDEISSLLDCAVLKEIVKAFTKSLISSLHPTANDHVDACLSMISNSVKKNIGILGNDTYGLLQLLAAQSENFIKSGEVEFIDKIHSLIIDPENKLNDESKKDLIKKLIGTCFEKTSGETLEKKPDFFVKLIEEYGKDLSQETRILFVMKVISLIIYNSKYLSKLCNTAIILLNKYRDELIKKDKDFYITLLEGVFNNLKKHSGDNIKADGLKSLEAFFNLNKDYILASKEAMQFITQYGAASVSEKVYISKGLLTLVQSFYNEIRLEKGSVQVQLNESTLKPTVSPISTEEANLPKAT